MTAKIPKIKRTACRRIKLSCSRARCGATQPPNFALFEGHVSFLNRDSDVLRRLAVDARDPNALVALYERHGKKIRQAAIRSFGRQSEIYNRAVNNILVSIGKKAATYDPKSADVADWIYQCAEAEARRLSEALETAASKRPRKRRAL